MAPPGSNDLVTTLFCVVVAYPVGVALNFLARFVGWANQRSSVDIASDPALRHVKDAV
ncbi:MAG: hypothetical protein QOC65_162, partial [Sphingomonadales bacterium]|nr:hypothetical protein [Sphingomonadales bacterium]